MRLYFKTGKNVVRLFPKLILNIMGFALLVGATPTRTHAQTVYVNRCAVGPADGSQSKPYATLSRGLAEAAPNSKLVVAAGSYPQPLTVGQWSNQKNLTIIAQGGPVLVGGVLGTQETCPCGRKDQMCCDGGRCDNGLVCNGGRCEPPPTPSPTPQSSQPTIAVSSEGSGSASTFHIKGTGFDPNHSVTIRLTYFIYSSGGATPADQYITASSTSSGQLDTRIAVPCLTGAELRFTATDGRPDPNSTPRSSLWSNTVVTSCP